MADTIRYRANFEDGKDYGPVEVMDNEGFQHPFAPNQTKVVTVNQGLTVTAPVAVDSAEQPARI